MRFKQFFEKARVFPSRGCCGYAHRGFSIIEMIVVISIITLMTSVVLFNKRDFNNSVLLTNLSYDVALTIREAQVYGIAVRGFAGGGGISFGKGYGVHFAEAADVINNYIFFVDGSGAAGSPPGSPTQIYEPDEESLKDYSLASGYSFKFCVYTTNVTPDACSDIGNDQTLDIVFKRPDPDASFAYFADNSSPNPPQTNLNKIEVIIVAPDGMTERRVAVYRNGQIAVCGSAPC